MSDASREARLTEAGDRLANIVEHNVPASYLSIPTFRRALDRWDEVARETDRPPEGDRLHRSGENPLAAWAGSLPLDGGET